MYRYTVFDVETPNRFNDRMSAIGVSVIEDGEIREEYFTYVNPETFFDRFNTQLTGIDQNTVRDAPSFPVLWKRLEPVFSRGILVAHNAPFDLGVLKKCLAHYRIEWKPSVRYCCTARMGRALLPGMKHNLNILCSHYGIPLEHHQADSDSHACAEILLRYIRDGADAGSFIRTYRLQPKQQDW